MKTAQTIEAQNSLKAKKPSKDGTKRGQHPNCLKNLKPYVPGQSGNPGGLPGYDVAAALARAVIEGAQVDAYQGLAKQLANGNGYVFKELAERGYGAKTQQVRVEVTDTTAIMERLKKGRERAAKSE